MKLWSDQKPYYSANQYYREIFGHKVYKISLDIGCTCPTRDGTLSFKGCTFCSANGSGDFAIAGQIEIREKINAAIEMVSNKSKSLNYIAYLQSFSNTYGDVDKLVSVYKEILADDRIIGLSIGTRPDCLSDEMILQLKKLAEDKFIWVELGLQTIHDKTAQIFNRGYNLDMYEHAVEKLKEKNIPIIVHLIVGLMGETYKDFMETINYIAKQPISGVKMSMLHILDNSPLGKEYKEKSFPLLDKETYIMWVASAITKIPQQISIHRVTGDGDHKHLIAPNWSRYKRTVITQLHKYMVLNKMYHGCHF